MYYKMDYEELGKAREIKIGKRGAGKKQFIRERNKRKVSKALKKHRRLIIAVLIFLGLSALILFLNSLANEWRGYKAIGGEILLYFAPFLIVSFRDLFHEFFN